MINKEKILSSINKIDDRLLVSKIIDKIDRAGRAISISHTDFLDPHQRILVEKVLRGSKEIEYTFVGGYDGAERVIAIFRPFFVSEEHLPNEPLPLKTIRITSNAKEPINHRDYLGALMGLGIKREKIGDILVGEDSCSVFVLNEIADYICYNLKKVGKINVFVDISNVEDIVVPEQETKEIKATVASLRLDSIVGSGYGISRAKASELIKAERVSLNWEATNSLTKLVKEGDTISLKGKGRIKVEKINGITKKGRISVILKKMI